MHLKSTQVAKFCPGCASSNSCTSLVLSKHFRVYPIFLVTDRVTYKIEKGRVVGTGHCLALGRGEGKLEDFDCS